MEGAGTMLCYRVLSAVVGIPLAVVLVCAGGLWLTLPVCALAMIGFLEFADKARAKRVSVLTALGLPLTLALVLLAHARTVPEGALLHLTGEGYGTMLSAVVFALVMGCLALYVVGYHHDRSLPVVANVGATVLATLYVGVTFSFFPLLRAFGDGRPSTPLLGIPWLPVDLGARLLLVVMAATWVSDTLAYFAGVSIGRTTLSPTSPNKTVEGLFGGFLGALVTALLLGAWLHVPAQYTLPVGVAIGVLGQVGDLCKSVLKRDLGTKDFGTLIPGHGGVLDRFDSLMMNVPVAYFCALLTL